MNNKKEFFLVIHIIICIIIFLFFAIQWPEHYYVIQKSNKMWYNEEQCGWFHTIELGGPFENEADAEAELKRVWITTTPEPTTIQRKEVQ